MVLLPTAPAAGDVDGTLTAVSSSPIPAGLAALVWRWCPGASDSGLSLLLVLPLSSTPLVLLVLASGNLGVVSASARQVCCCVMAADNGGLPLEMAPDADAAGTGPAAALPAVVCRTLAVTCRGSTAFFAVAADSGAVAVTKGVLPGVRRGDL